MSEDWYHTAPRWNSTDWAMIEGNPAFTIDFLEDETLYDFDNFRAPLTVVASLYGQDITSDILDSDVAWTRYTENRAGEQRVTSDNIWSLEVGSKAGKAIVLTQSDLSIDSEGVPAEELDSRQQLHFVMVWAMRSPKIPSHWNVFNNI